ncbi:MAG TPA: helix-turn-helix transcriptional regulator [Candidatus Baltobacteraceae bacterium]|jgi:transcriptional regulator with XRE-family HTH domain
MNDVVAFVSEQLASKRAECGISLEEAARRSDIHEERLASAENAETTLDEAELQRLADAYGIDVTNFFGGRVTPLAYLFGAG